MATTFNIIFYVLTFLAVYVQVFLLVTFLENRKTIKNRKGKVVLARYPTVTVTVPCFNEERTIYKTVRSLLDLNYPKEKLKIFLVDDGSTDGTLNIIQKFAKYSNVKVFHKENGGKHTALNLGLENCDTEFSGCLDADSYVDSDSLVRIMSYFERDESTMAVAPSIEVSNPKNIIEYAQKAEYYMSIYVKKMLGLINAIHVTPGPLTIFRRKVFEELGPYRSAHNTEYMEIAYRMQKNHMKIEQCHDAFVYTNTPSSVRRLYQQRLRWIYGFINNTIDYRGVLFQKKYGNFSLFTVPAGIVSIIAASYLFSRIAIRLWNFVEGKIVELRTVGFEFSSPFYNFDPFFINTKSVLFVILILYSLVIVSIVLGHKIAEKKVFPLHILYFFSIYSVVAPFWLFSSIYNTIVAKRPSWR